MEYMVFTKMCILIGMLIIAIICMFRGIDMLIGELDEQWKIE